MLTTYSWNLNDFFQLFTTSIILTATLNDSSIDTIIEIIKKIFVTSEQMADNYILDYFRKNPHYVTPSLSNKQTSVKL